MVNVELSGRTTLHGRQPQGGFSGVWVCLVSLVRRTQTNETDQTDQMNQLPATRCAMGPDTVPYSLAVAV